MIVSNKFIKARYGRPLRRLLSHDSRIDTIADFAGASVFQGATVRTVVIVGSKAAAETANGKITYVPVPDPQTMLELANFSTTVRAYSEGTAFTLAASALAEDEWQLLPEDYVEVLNKLRNGSVMLADWLGSSALFGLKTGLNDAFVIDQVKREELILADARSAEVIRPILFGRDVRRYFVNAHERFVIYLHPDRDVETYPAVREHLAQHRDALERRAASQKWFELQQPATSLIVHNRQPKIAYPIIANECRFAIDNAGYFINDKLFTLPSSDRALLSILNSRLANFYFAGVCVALEGASDSYLEFRAQYVDKFPLPQKYSEQNEDGMLSSLAERMLSLHERLARARIERERTVIGHQISATDRQIDGLVYELYGLTDEEIRIVEEATAR